MFISKSAKSPFYQLTYINSNGKRTTVSTRTTDVKQAEIFLQSFVPGATETNDPPPPQPQKELTLVQFQNEYVKFITASTSKSYVRSVKLSFKMLKEFCGDFKLCFYNFRLIDNFVSQTFQRTQRGAALYYRTLKAAFNKAENWNYISANPFKKVKLPKLSKSFPAFMSHADLQLIIDNTPQVYLQRLFTLAFHTGLRLGEIVNMQWGWVNFESKIITVRCSDAFTAKSKKERIIPMNETLYNLLLAQSSDTGNNPAAYVFARIKPLKLTEDFVSKHFKKAVRAAKLDDRIHTHSLRHSFASNLVQRGASIFVVKELLGHEDIKTTLVYAHLNQDSLKYAVNLL